MSKNDERYSFNIVLDTCKEEHGNNKCKREFCERIFPSSEFVQPQPRSDFRDAHTQEDHCETDFIHSVFICANNALRRAVDTKKEQLKKVKIN